MPIDFIFDPCANSSKNRSELLSKIANNDQGDKTIVQDFSLLNAQMDKTEKKRSRSSKTASWGESQYQTNTMKQDVVFKMS